jgi:hypothetical protein
MSAISTKRTRKDARKTSKSGSGGSGDSEVQEIQRFKSSKVQGSRFTFRVQISGIFEPPEPEP